MAKRYTTRCILSLAVLAVTILLQAAPALAGPSWAGPVGNSLTEAANAYLEAILNEPKERLARRKAELELERLRAETERLRAETERLRAETERYAQQCATHTSTYQGRPITCETCCSPTNDGPDCRTYCR